jgi:hypothetical protein
MNPCGKPTRLRPDLKGVFGIVSPRNFFSATDARVMMKPVADLRLILHPRIVILRPDRSFSWGIIFGVKLLIQFLSERHSVSSFLCYKKFSREFVVPFLPKTNWGLPNLSYPNLHLLHTIKGRPTEGTPKDLVLQSRNQHLRFIEDLSVPLATPDLLRAIVAMKVFTPHTGDIVVREERTLYAHLIAEWDVARSRCSTADAIRREVWQGFVGGLCHLALVVSHRVSSFLCYGLLR